MPDIFIPVPMYLPGKERPSGAVNSYYQVADYQRDYHNRPYPPNFNFENMAEILTARSKNQKLQVGNSYIEAEEIASQHSFFSRFLIVKVTIPQDDLLTPCSEKELASKSRVNVNSTNSYPVLKKDSSFKSEQICSVRPMEHYKNSNRYEQSSMQCKYWPAGMTVANARYASEDYHATNVYSHTPDAPPFVSDEQREKIEAVIAQLTSEVESIWFFLCRGIKQEKIEGLQSLLSLTYHLNLSEAIQNVEDKHPKIRSGFWSRTAVLLDELKSSSEDNILILN